MTVKPGDGNTYEISVTAGRKHRLQVKKDGFKVFGEEVEIATGGRWPVKVTLDPFGNVPVNDAKEENVVPLAAGLKYTEIKVGSGPEAQKGDTVQVHYTGWLKRDGMQFVSGEYWRSIQQSHFTPSRSSS